MGRGRENSKLGLLDQKNVKKCFKNRCCVYTPDRLARANTWALERPDTRKPHSSEKKLARAKNAMLQVCNPGARSSDRILARAKKHCPQAYTRRNRSLERSKSGSSLKTQKQTSIERPNPVSRDQPKNWTATLGFRTQPTRNKPAQHILKLQMRK